ncbi:hypothetical protein NKJ06_26100 [Mesorhizobium sp. M0293]|uniref:hypothetical protein n=1 Tax=Mesorhizobium sp. M0293 TaxID=2956930 RepID=UPI003334E812
MSALSRDKWVAEIARKSGKSASDVEALLKRLGIEPKLTHAIPKRLKLRSLAFTGEKTGDYETKVIDFARSSLEPGMHAFVSEVNLKGKTSLLKIIRWALTGTRTLPSDMSGWFRTLTLGFSLDNDEYEVRLLDAELGSGLLVKQARGREFVVAEFPDTAGFVAAMDSFFLSELGLEPLEVIAERDGKGVDQRHGWNWLFGVLWISPDPKAVFGGDDTSHGKSTRAMQMYLGLPWITTRAQLMEAQKRARLDTEQESRKARQVSDAARSRLDELQKKRDVITAEADDRPSAGKLRTDVSTATAAYASYADKLRRNVSVIEELEAEYRHAEAALTAASRELNAFRENRAAGYVFRSLNPVSCPSCEEAYTADVRETRHSNHDCVVCGRAERPESDSTEGVEERLTADVTSAKEGAGKLKKRLAEARRKSTDFEEARDAQARVLEQLEKELDELRSVPDGRLELVKLDAQIEELTLMVGTDRQTEATEVDLLEAAIKATKKMYEEEQETVLTKVSELALTYAQAFGLTDLLGVQLKGNTHMELQMRGGKKNFGEGTPGERMRLKLAATLAMIQVAEKSGIGRHPGVLLIDSVGNNEVVKKDVAKMVVGLSGLSDSLPTVQIFVAGVKSDAILDHVPCGNVIENREDGYLW